jgi:hypothetical protein
MGGMVSGIMSTSNPTFFGSFCPFFTSFLKRPPWQQFHLTKKATGFVEKSAG